MDIECRYCGSSDYSTEMKSGQNVATCNNCGRFIKNIPYSEPGIYFGKYKGKLIKDFQTKEEINYLYWIRNNPDIWYKMKDRIKEAINYRLDGK